MFNEDASSLQVIYLRIVLKLVWHLQLCVIELADGFCCKLCNYLAYWRWSNSDMQNREWLVVEQYYQKTASDTLEMMQ